MIVIEPKRCRRMCPGGYQCGCDGAIKHAHHICSNPKRPCHSREAYEQANIPAQPQNESRTA